MTDTHPTHRPTEPTDVDMLTQLALARCVEYTVATMLDSGEYGDRSEALATIVRWSDSDADEATRRAARIELEKLLGAGGDA